MRGSASRAPLAPLATLFALAVLAMAWVASAHVCARPLVMSGAAATGDMSTMDMASGAMPMLRASNGTMMMCPVVVGLIVLATLLAGWTIVTVRRDVHRGLTTTVLVRALARLPLLRTFGTLAVAGGCAIAAIVAVDGNASFSPALGALLALILGAISLGATVGSVVVARCIIAFCARVLIAIARAIAQQRDGGRCAVRIPDRPPHAAVVALAFGRGLRAPPLRVH